MSSKAGKIYIYLSFPVFYRHYLIFRDNNTIRSIEARIRRRKTESEEIIQERLQKGKKEMTMTEQYDYIILNDDVARASQEIVDLIKKKLKEGRK